MRGVFREFEGTVEVGEDGTTRARGNALVSDWVKLSLDISAIRQS